MRQYVQDFFIDRGNFPTKQTPAWDALPHHRMRKLFSRIDHDEYTDRLEAMLLESGAVANEQVHPRAVRAEGPRLDI
jgi:hypothetical protein